MKIGEVVGTVVSTINHPSFDGHRLLMCDLINPEGERTGVSLIAVDGVDAGPGEIVLIMDEGSSARQVLDDAGAPIRAVIVGIVDQLSLA